VLGALEGKEQLTGDRDLKGGSVFADILPTTNQVAHLLNDLCQGTDSALEVECVTTTIIAHR